MNIIQIGIALFIGFVVGKYQHKERSGKCGYCGGDLYVSSGETYCEKCGAII